MTLTIYNIVLIVLFEQFKTILQTLTFDMRMCQWRVAFTCY